MIVMRIKPRLLYPAEFRVPADSDYDDQEDFDPIDTPLMPLDLQDMKLRIDYINLPLLKYVFLLSILQMLVPEYTVLLMSGVLKCMRQVSSGITTSSKTIHLYGLP